MAPSVSGTSRTTLGLVRAGLPIVGLAGYSSDCSGHQQIGLRSTGSLRIILCRFGTSEIIIERCLFSKRFVSAGRQAHSMPSKLNRSKTMSGGD